MDILSTISTRRTPQSQPATPAQERNAAGGYTFTLTDEQRLRRFLVLGTDGGTYYTSPRDLSRDNAAVVLRMAEQDPDTLLAAILDVSLRGAAPKQNPTLFALAVACSVGPSDARSRALAVVPQVARTGTHLFIFARYVQQFRGWGRGLRRSVQSWYLTKEVDQLAYQAVKYRQREGWSHRDLLRKAHPDTPEPERRAVFDWIAHGRTDRALPRLIEAFEKVQSTDTLRDVIAAVDAGLSWEMVPDRWLAEPDLWDALLEKGMPQTALMRQLPRLTRLGLLPAMGGRTGQVVAQLTDAERLAKARVHPINVLVAQRTYASGASARGESTWTPTRRVVDALDAAFYAAFGAVEPTGKSTMLALDVSGSMAAPISGMPLTCREASAALALVTAATEPEHLIVGFTGQGSFSFPDLRGTVIRELPIGPRQRLDDAIRAVSNIPFGATDCSLPMAYATERKLPVDTFVVYTDNETWAGREHPHQALRRYRQQSGRDAKLVVVGMTATRFSIADPSDPGMLDVAGFDTAVPSLVSEFSRGL